MAAASNVSRSRLGEIGAETVKILTRGWYDHPEAGKVEITPLQDKAIAASSFYSSDELRDIPRNLDRFDQAQPIFEVTQERSLTAAGRLINEGRVDPDEITVLNYASAKHPGGGFLSGARAQEENISRCSGLYPCLTKFQTEFYHAHSKRPAGCLYSDRMIFSPAVPVIRNDATYEFIAFPYTVNMLTSPAVNFRAYVAGQNRQNPNNPPSPDDLRTTAYETMTTRTEKLLALCANVNQTTLVLGAWGCGAFGNSPEDVANIFGAFLKEGGMYCKSFKHVLFAVFDPHRDQPNYNAFSRIFAND